MPTKTNFEELLNTNNCTNEHVANYKGSGVAGRLFTSVANGKTLFFPYAGYVEGSTLQDDGDSGNYWSALLQNPQTAFELYASSDNAHIDSDSRCYGYTVRAVK